MTKIAGSGSGSISQRHGSSDQDPDPHQNVMDLELWVQLYRYTREQCCGFRDPVLRRPLDLGSGMGKKN
jgi:hypothetical protein